MAPKYLLPDGTIGTIEDSDLDVPNYEEEEEEEEETESLSEPSKKRKREDPPAKKKKNKKQKQEANKENEEETEQAPGPTGAEFNPEFEFDVEPAISGDVLDGWNFGKSKDDDKPTSAGIDEIIQRRREREREARAAAAADDSDAVNEEADDDDDELLAEDGFGMGAEREDDDEDEGDEEGNDDDEEHSDSENEEAKPVPHPDDFASDDDMNDESEAEAEEDPEEKARRDAFFAPEDTKASKSASASSFLSLNLSRPILKGINSLGFTAPTPIQSKTVPVALLGKDVVGGAVTGSGKTAAFVIPILERLLFRSKVPTTRVAILMPTRELAVQCYNVATKLATYTDITFALIVGGLSLREQEQVLKKRPDVVIATPGRFIDHMRNTAAFAVEDIEILVLDEADRMLEDGFADELNEIVTSIPRQRQTMLFSATMTEDIDKLIRVGMSQPVRLLVDSKKQTVSGLVQEFIKLKPSKKSAEDLEHRRLATLLHLCTYTYSSKCIVFIPTKHLAHRVKVLFALHGLAASELHGSMSQEQRLQAIASFRDGRATHLLATDLAARGLDVPRVESVINFTVPAQAATYIHRVGRTARAGRQGVACTIFASAKESSSSKKKNSKAASERALLKPIMKIAKDQKAVIRTRTLPIEALAALAAKVTSEQEEIDAILEEEKEERLLAASERDMRKGENLIKYEEEIASRPKRTWFQTEKEKAAAKDAGMDERLGLFQEALAKQDKKKKKLSGKEKKRLELGDERKKGTSWQRAASAPQKGVLKGRKEGGVDKKQRYGKSDKSKANGKTNGKTNGKGKRR